MVSIVLGDFIVNLSAVFLLHILYGKDGAHSFQKLQTFFLIQTILSDVFQ